MFKYYLEYITDMYDTDLDYLINRLKGNDVTEANNLMEILIKMAVMGYENEFIHYLFEIADSGYLTRFIAGEYDYDQTLENFDTSLRVEDKLKTLSIIGNEMFVDFSEECFVMGPRSMVMLTILVRLLIEARLYVVVVNFNELYLDIESQEKQD